MRTTSACSVIHRYDDVQNGMDFGLSRSRAHDHSLLGAETKHAFSNWLRLQEPLGLMQPFRSSRGKEDERRHIEPNEQLDADVDAQAAPRP